ncbi:5734_t:CDS:2 [Ambispora gerdemannii]|uniref:5734_t:CDS:1 n=1 Tax=Ambispora gerdemannii TaxID=144530 RepID=A0A9N9FVT8_9GLOM|nr:5734_t:CDS:2 [Ambispora gerdemannii]
MPSTLSQININSSSNTVVIDNNNNDYIKPKKKRNIFQKSGSKICRLFNCKGKKTTSKNNISHKRQRSVPMTQTTTETTVVSYQERQSQSITAQIPVNNINDINVIISNADSVTNKNSIISNADETITSINNNNIITTDNSNSTAAEYQLTAYDIAWVAMIPTSRYKQTKDPRDFMLAFPECFRWLLNYQDSKGSWGKIGVKSIVPSLSVLLSLRFFKARAGEYFQAKLEDIGITINHFQQMVTKGEAFLRKTLKNWNIDSNQSTTPHEKMILYYLEELEKFNPSNPFDFPSRQKLRNNNIISRTPHTRHSALLNLTNNYVPVETLISITMVTDSHSLASDFTILHNNYRTSPAATASYLILAPHWDREAFGLLQNMINNWKTVLATSGQTNNITTTTSSFPHYDFESCLVIECLGDLVDTIESVSPNDNNLSSLHLKFEDIVKYLREQLEEQDGIILTAIPLNNNKSLYKINYTALALRLITQFDPLNRIDIESFIQSFWNGKYFNHLPNDEQKVTSTVFNVHALEVLLIEREKLKNRKQYRISFEVETALGKYTSFNLDYIITSTITFIQSQRAKNFLWLDDAPHNSPWYTTMQTIKTLLSLVEHPRVLVSTSFKNKPSLMAYCRSTIDHALATQHPDGSWGTTSSYDALGNLEETSYVIQLLKIANEYGASDHALMDALAKGCDYLFRHFDSAMNDPNYFYNFEPPLWGNHITQRLVRALILCALKDPSSKNNDDDIGGY